MLKVQEIRELIRLIDQSGIDEFTYEYDGTKLVMKKNKATDGTRAKKEEPVVTMSPVVETPVPKPEAVPGESPVVQKPEAATEIKRSEEGTETEYHKIVSPMVGTFYKAPSPGAEPYVKIGSKVTEKTIVCIVEAMKLFNEIEADVKGEIVDILVEDGQLVEYGQPLFLVKEG